MIGRFLSKLFPPPSTGGKPGPGFHLVRYFMLTSLVAFVVVGVVLVYLQSQEEQFFSQVQHDQAEFFVKAQEDLAAKQDQAARKNLLRVHESGHVNLTRMFANALWNSDFAPFVERVGKIPIDHCRAIVVPATGGSGAAEARRRCFAEVGVRIRALPDYAAVDAKTRAMMHKSFVFKIKVFDLRGVTVYSSEPAQIGEDALKNLGWVHASGGTIASELTHRDKFSAFEGMVENRDLISTYMPVVVPGSERLLGVFEIYSDVTPLLEEIKSASARLAAISTANQVLVEQAAARNRAKVEANSGRLLLVVGALLAILYLVLLALVKTGQRFIDQHHLAQEQALQREASWHHEKMAALATMATHVAHEVGNPLAIIAGEADAISAQKAGEGNCAECNPDEIIRQTRRLARMTRQIADFAAARSEAVELIDVNQMVKVVCDFLSFDRRFRNANIDFRAGAALPAARAVPDHLNECLMNLFQACTDGKANGASVRGPIIVETGSSAETGVTICVSCGASPATDTSAWADRLGDPRFELVRRRIEAMGGRFSADQGAIRIELPVEQESIAEA